MDERQLAALRSLAAGPLYELDHRPVEPLVTLRARGWAEVVDSFEDQAATRVVRINVLGLTEAGRTELARHGPPIN